MEKIPYHLYLGAEVVGLGSARYILAGATVDGGLMFKTKEGGFNIDLGTDFKLCLRSPNSLTDEEIKQLLQWNKLTREYVDVSFERVKSVNGNMVGVLVHYTVVEEDFVQHQSWTLHFSACNPRDFYWLVSRYFWLFGDEAFEKGLIVNS